MKPIHASVAALGLVFALNACDDPPKPEAKPEASAAPAASVAPAPAPTPSAVPEPAAPTPPKKTLAECGKGPNAEFDQPGLEAEIRKKLQKPDGAITLADL